MRVLYLNHTSRVSGAERSFLTLVTRMAERAEVAVVAPPGELLARARAEGIDTFDLECPAVNFNSRVRELPAASWEFVRRGRQLRSLGRHVGADVIHAGSTRAGLIAAYAGRGPARVVDVRDVLPSGAKGSSVRSVLRLSCDALVFNSRHTQARFGPFFPARGVVVPPAIELDELLRLRQRTLGSPPMLGVIGQLTPWKAQDDAIRLLALIRRWYSEARLRIVGSVVFPGADNEAYAASLPQLAASLGVADAVELAGQREELADLLASLDVLLVPSWEEPFGRVVAEAMAAGVPVVATSRGGPAEQIEDGVSGFLVEPRRPELWVEPVSRLLGEPALRERVRAEARRRVGGAAASVAAVAELYEELVFAAVGT